jgi:hypothetical protein
MSRSTYIYLAMDTGQLFPVAAFTVRSELRGWLMSKPDSILPQLAVFRMPDNPWRSSGGITELKIADVISDRQPPAKPAPGT